MAVKPNGKTHPVAEQIFKHPATEFTFQFYCADGDEICPFRLWVFRSSPHVDICLFFDKEGVVNGHGRYFGRTKKPSWIKEARKPEES